jgi:hypothetical protein
MGVSGNNFASQQDIDQLSKPYEGRFEVDVKRQVMMPYYDQVTSKVTGYDKEQAIEKREMQVRPSHGLLARLRDDPQRAHAALL